MLTRPAASPKEGRREKGISLALSLEVARTEHMCCIVQVPHQTEVTGTGNIYLCFILISKKPGISLWSFFSQDVSSFHTHSQQTKRTPAHSCWTSSSSEDVTSAWRPHPWHPHCRSHLRGTHSGSGRAWPAPGLPDGQKCGLVPCQRSLQSHPQPHVMDMTFPALLSTSGHRRHFVPFSLHYTPDNSGFSKGSQLQLLTIGSACKAPKKIPTYKSNCKSA